VKATHVKSTPSIFRRIAPKFSRYALGLGRSGIQGTGVYALEDLPARRRVVEYIGRKLTRVQAARLTFPNDMYLVGAKRGRIIDGRIGGNGSQFINHSCAPNLKWVRKKGRLYFATLRKIRAGEELTLCYRYATRMRRIPCRCGARNCRGTLRLEFKGERSR
jgi:SET domain-containing protein